MVAVAGLILTACGSEDNDGDAFPEQLAGRYEADLAEAAGTLVVTIGEDRSFLIKRPAHRPFSVGPITVDDETIVLSPDEFGDCTRKGTYAYRIEDGKLTLTSVDDPCAFRVKDLNRTFVPTSAVPPAVAAERRALERYRLRRNAICKKRTAEAEAVNASASSVGEDVALRRSAAVMRTTAAELDKLDVPRRFAEFVRRDRQLRTERIRLHEQLADAYEKNQSGADALGRELVQDNVIPTEAAEDQFILTHCP